MEFVIPYLVFAIATGVCSVLFVLSPAVHILKSKGAENDTFVKHQVLSTIVFFIMSTLLAPLFILAVVSGSVAREAINGLVETTDQIS
jgi:uncharacterized membrane protein YciS (DUF1049 family)